VRRLANVTTVLPDPAFPRETVEGKPFVIPRPVEPPALHWYRSRPTAIAVSATQVVYYWPNCQPELGIPWYLPAC